MKERSLEPRSHGRRAAMANGRIEGVPFFNGTKTFYAWRNFMVYLRFLLRL